MSKSRAIQAKERQAQVKRLGKFARGLLLTAATVMTFATAMLLLADKIYRPDAFAITQVKIKGKFDLLDVKDVQKKAVAEGLGNFFSVDLVAVQSRIKTLPWVREVDVRREWPNTLLINVSEHRPIMRWETAVDHDQSKPKTDQWVSARGKIVSIDTKLERTSPIVLSGIERDAPKILSSALRWQKSFRDMGLMISEVELSPSQSWQMVIAYENSGRTFNLLLGKKNIEQRLQRFLVLYQNQFRVSEQLIVRADARYPDGLALVAEPRPEDKEFEGIERKVSVTPKLIGNSFTHQFG
ncbi:MAG: FtsQ-type POTRA domain-containing protein [Gammaproteobacteria bacterium]|nr:FtsQ-type POTRA domain-containing protein [Gammaproteobacteria bacterium]